ncbi:DUF2269 family protein [Leeia aquatica]|uniref:DUF2269 domain-containing protein n=1 Tax=Leeia aquatica TaxID=2725557 RepID=A0A847SCP3_9NEIS|nr:DUF2269 domain-containing protein [Leeia aquatica]NLR73722.1 DUF2269 domain-containing protein [Leeia aquatica]
MSYLLLKYLHILSATLMFGTGLGTAFYMFVTNRGKQVQSIATVSHWVVKADWWFTTPAVIFQPISGLWMAHLAGWPLHSHWLLVTFALYALAAICWLPVVWLQLRMRDMAHHALQHGEPLPARYWQYERLWTLLGIPAFVGLLVVYWMMVAKPA